MKINNQENENNISNKFLFLVNNNKLLYNNKIF